MSSQDYAKRYSRNIGILTSQEQESISHKVIAVAGVGGIGGHVIGNLARMGFQKFKIADLDHFDFSNTNRQIGALQSTIGLEKVQVIKNMILDINPEAQVEVFSDGITDLNVEKFVQGADAVVDSLDFFCLKPRKLVYQACQKFKKSVFLSAPLGFSATLHAFTPDSMSPDQYFGWKEGQSPFQQLILFSIGIAPSALHLKYLKFDREFLIKNQTGPSIASGCTLGGALVANEVLYYLIERRATFSSPQFTQFDPFVGRYVRRRLWFGAAGLIQKLKYFFALKYYGPFEQEFSKFIK